MWSTRKSGLANPGIHSSCISAGDAVAASSRPMSVMQASNAIARLHIPRLAYIFALKCSPAALGIALIPPSCGNPSFSHPHYVSLGPESANGRRANNRANSASGSARIAAMRLSVWHERLCQMVMVLVEGAVAVTGACADAVALVATLARVEALALVGVRALVEALGLVGALVLGVALVAILALVEALALVGARASSKPLCPAEVQCMWAASATTSFSPSLPTSVERNTNMGSCASAYATTT